ncbi:MAG: SDR family NAD(P)-dependent oxidoreductase [Planctomycetota bacterium]
MPRAKKDLRGRHVVVTGAGTGIGRAIALRLAERGARLALLARRRKPLAETAALAEEAGAEATFVRSVDVRDRQKVDRGFAAAAKELGPVWALVANSGVGGPNGPASGERAADDRFDDLVATNLNGTYFCMRAAERHLAEGPDERHLVAVSSILARIGVPGYSGYCASKAALLGLSRALAAELAPGGVQVNAVCPGWVDTEMAWEGIDGMAQGLGVSRDEAFAMAMSDVPMGRMGKPEDVAGLVSWLLSRDARGVTGQGLDMNNGAYMS